MHRKRSFVAIKGSNSKLNTMICRIPSMSSHFVYANVLADCKLTVSDWLIIKDMMVFIFNIFNLLLISDEWK